MATRVPLLYSDLIAVAQSELSAAALANARSALVGRRGYLTHRGLTDSDLIGHELTDEPAISAWLATLDPTGTPGSPQTSTVRAYHTRVLAWRELLARVQRNTDLPTDPCERLTAVLQRALDERRCTQQHLAHELGVAPTTLHYYLHGSSLLSRGSARKIEHALELPAGTLAACVTTPDLTRVPSGLIPADFGSKMRQRLRNRLPQGFHALSRAEQAEAVTCIAAEIRANPTTQKRRFANSNQYRIDLATLPERTQAEISEFLDDYKTPAVLRSGVRRHAKGRLHSPASVLAWRQLFRAFFGWCALPTPEQVRARGDTPNPALEGPGLALDEACIGLLAVPKLVEDFLIWRHSETRKSQPNQAMLVTISMLSTLVHPVTGYLTQHPELVARIPQRYRNLYWASYEDYLREVGRQQDDLLAARAALGAARSAA